MYFFLRQIPQLKYSDLIVNCSWNSTSLYLKKKNCWPFPKNNTLCLQKATMNETLHQVHPPKRNINGNPGNNSHCESRQRFIWRIHRLISTIHSVPFQAVCVGSQTVWCNSPVLSLGTPRERVSLSVEWDPLATFPRLFVDTTGYVSMRTNSFRFPLLMPNELNSFPQLNVRLCVCFGYRSWCFLGAPRRAFIRVPGMLEDGRALFWFVILIVRINLIWSFYVCCDILG